MIHKEKVILLYGKYEKAWNGLESFSPWRVVKLMEEDENVDMSTVPNFKVTKIRCCYFSIVSK
jgi:hypothetical protein